MKLIIAVVSDEDSETVANELNDNGFNVTKLCSSGSFFKAGNTTLLVGAEDDKVQEVICIIERKSRARKQFINSSAYHVAGIFMVTPVEITVGGATIFVTNLEMFKKTS